MVILEQYSIQENESGYTVFQFLRKKYSVRILRSLIKYNALVVNGKPVNKSYILQSGDTLSITKVHATYSFPLTILFSTADYMAIYKPSDTHSVHIAGKPTPSLETMLREQYEFHALCTRLDYGTSGILFIAKTKESYLAFRRYEEEKQVRKIYTALVEGLCPPCSIENAIYTAKTKKSRVLEKASTDRLRYTHVLTTRPLIIQDTQCSLITCMIYKGARHQIRAHLSHIGFPLVGDYTYGASIKNESFFLHNSCVHFLDMKIEAPLPKSWAKYVK